MNVQQNIHQLVDHLFRADSGKMVSVLSKIFGMDHLQVAEDIVQQTFLKALDNWAVKGTPDSPSDWLFLVARNYAIDLIRKNRHAVSYDFSDNERVLLSSEYTLATAMDNMCQEKAIEDDMLEMMFACCHPGIPPEAQIGLVLKTLCGFSTADIARALLTGEDTISKRLYRAKEFFRENRIKLAIPDPGLLKERTNAVLNSIYLLFNGGYNFSHSDQHRNRQVMNDALMLGKLLAANRHTQFPEVYALIALLCFHLAKSENRWSPEGEIILLQHQDRTKWDTTMIALGNCYLAQAAFGEEISPYHLEAAIAFEHCRAVDFQDTDWARILQLYDWLCHISPSPIASLNRVIAVMQVEGPEKALRALQDIPDQNKMEKYYLFYSLLGEIHAQLGNAAVAIDNFTTASRLTNSTMEKGLLAKKIAAITPA